MIRLPGLHTEKDAMRELRNDIFSHLISQKGILPSMMRRHSSLGMKIVAWLTGEKPILVIGGEPASGKSLLMGELTLRYNELVKPHVDLQLPLISYDRVHYLFLKRLMEVSIGSAHDFLPEGETHPGARKYITHILRDVLQFAVLSLPKNIPIIFEAPLIDHRGEDVVDALAAWGASAQVFILHSPAMQSRILQQEEQRTRGMSARPPAIRQIHEGLLKQRGITSRSQQAQDDELMRSWKQWLGDRDGLVLSWDPADDEAGLVYTKEILRANHIPSNPLTPQAINKYTASRIEVVLGELPDLEAFAIEVKGYRPKFR